MSVPVSRKTCSECGAVFECGAGDNAEANAGKCWCSAWPQIMPLEPGQDCRCPDCLKKIIRQKLDEFVESTPVGEAVEMAAGYRQQTGLIDGIDYTTENGKLVFSAWYHLKRGNCCGNGCRHCPY